MPSKSWSVCDLSGLAGEFGSFIHVQLSCIITIIHQTQFTRAEGRKDKLETRLRCCWFDGRNGFVPYCGEAHLKLSHQLRTHLKKYKYLISFFCVSFPQFFLFPIMVASIAYTPFTIFVLYFVKKLSQIQWRLLFMSHLYTTFS